MRRKSLARRVCQIVLAALLLAGCSDQAPAARELNTQRLQDQLATGIQAQTGVVVAVRCPGNVRLETGDEFQCALTAGDGSTRQVAVTQRDDRGNVSWKVMP
ncbi:MAG: DUF4333 domain-containing protein [Egibacteraceae bacterium]